MAKLTRRGMLGAAGLIATGRAWAADEDLYAAAKKEGRLNLYWGSYEQKTIEAIRDAFKARYPGIEVSLLRQASQTVYTRLRLELQNGIGECDSLGTTNVLHYIELKKIGALASYVPRENAKIPAAFRNLDPDGTYHVGAISLTTLAYQPQKIKTPPAGWRALLDAEWRGKITVGSPAYSGDVASWVVAMRRKFGDDYLTRFAAQQPKVGQSSVDAVTDILAGERVVGAAAPYSYTLAQKVAGNPIEVGLPDDDAILNLGLAGVMQKAPNPNAARLFTDFLYSTECSAILAANFWPTLRSDVPWAAGGSLDQLKWYRNPPEDLAAQVAEGITKWKEIFR